MRAAVGSKTEKRSSELLNVALCATRSTLAANVEKGRQWIAAQRFRTEDKAPSVLAQTASQKPVEDACCGVQGENTIAVKLFRHRCQDMRRPRVTGDFLVRRPMKKNKTAEQRAGSYQPQGGQLFRFGNQRLESEAIHVPAAFEYKTI